MTERTFEAWWGEGAHVPEGDYDAAECAWRARDEEIARLRSALEEIVRESEKLYPITRLPVMIDIARAALKGE